MARSAEQGSPFRRRWLRRASSRVLCRHGEIGEASGRLDVVLDALTDYYERMQSIASSVRSAVT
jgi:type II secretory pathway component PulF